MARKYPLEIKRYNDDDYDFGYYSKGFHETEEFMAACAEAHGEKLPAGDVENEQWRTVSTRDGLYMIPVIAGHGSYPVTVYRFHTPR